MKNRLMFTYTLLALLVCGVSSAMGTGGSETGMPAQELQELPVTKIVLFSTGLGYFQRTGIVHGAATVDLRFKTKDINDLLKSMILQDLDGGSISSVNYSSRDPLAVTLRSMSVDLSGNPGISGILSQLRGEEISVDLAGRSGAIRGLIVGLEHVSNPNGQSVQMLNLYGKSGIVGVEMQSIQGIRFVDPRLDIEFRKALQLLTEAKSSDEKRVTFGFTGEGNRRVLVGYLLETPVWKTSYRLVLGEEDEHVLQGWAIVENTTDEDWGGIDLTLVSGKPVSFIMDLYSPVYNRRPVIQIETAAVASVKAYEEAPRLSSRSAPSAAPSMVMEDYSGMGGGAFDDFDEYGVELDISQGVESAATTARAGQFFHYAIEKPVTLPRKESAMVPIVDEIVEGKLISIFNPRDGMVNPYNGLRFRNSTDIDLMGGPLTIFQAGTYAGDSRIGSVNSGDERILSYSVDLETEVRTTARSVEPRLVGIEIEKGIFVTETLNRQETDYALTGRGLREKSVLVEHPILQGWKLVEPAEPEERTASFYRFTVDLPKSGGGATEYELNVAEELTVFQRTDLLNASDSFIQTYIDLDTVEARVKTALRGIVERRKGLNETLALRRERENRRSAIYREQDRIRKNMVNLDEDTELYKQYVATLTAHEQELEEIDTRIIELTVIEQNQRNELEEYVRSLQLE